MSIPVIVKSLVKPAAYFFAIVALAGCQAYKLVSPATPTPVTGGYSVTPTVAWSKTTVLGDERWTTEGNVLQEIAFADIGPGENMLNAPIHMPAFQPHLVVSRAGENKLPRYGAAMTLLDVKDFIEATLVQVGALNVVLDDMQAARFGAADGFRLGFGFNMKSGLAYKGFIVGAQVGGRLKLMIYSAAEVFYYARNLGEAERLATSVQFAGPVAPATTTMASVMPAAPAPATPPAAQPANPNLIALPPRPDGVARRAPTYTALPPAPAMAPTPTLGADVVALPPCSSLPYEQPPGTRNINDAVAGGRNTALLPVAPLRRVDRPCIPDEPQQGTTIRDVISPGTGTSGTVRPITAIAPSAAISGPSVAAPAVQPLPLCSSLPMEQPPGTRNVADAAYTRGALLPVAAPVRVNKPCIPDPGPQGAAIRDAVAPNGTNPASLRPITTIQR